jgi:hypothetical protein
LHVFVHGHPGRRHTSVGAVNQSFRHFEQLGGFFAHRRRDPASQWQTAEQIETFLKQAFVVDDDRLIRAADILTEPVFPCS